MRRAAKHDSNHGEITAALRKLGWAVLSLSRVGGGCLDLLISKDLVSCLVEIKTEKGKLNALQLDFVAGWLGQMAVVRSVDDVIELNRKLLA